VLAQIGAKVKVPSRGAKSPVDVAIGGTTRVNPGDAINSGYHAAMTQLYSAAFRGSSAQ
jgi:hypothetical protein